MKKITLLLLGAIIITSCVSKKDFTELESKYAKLKKEKRAVDDQNKDCEDEKATLKTDLSFCTS